MNQEEQKPMNYRTCPFCGYEEEISEADQDPYGKGYWCSDCDSFIYFESDPRSAKVILEEAKKTSKKEEAFSKPSQEECISLALSWW